MRRIAWVIVAIGVLATAGCWMSPTPGNDVTVDAYGNLDIDIHRTDT